MTALAYADFLKNAARKEFAAGYLLAGSELFFRDKFRQALVKFFLDGQRQDVFEHDLAETPVRDALDDAASLGLFAGRRLLWLRNAEALLSRRKSTSDEDPERTLRVDGDGRSAGPGGSKPSPLPQTASKHSPEAIAGYFARPQPASVVVFEATGLDLADRDDLRKCERLEKLLPAPSVRLERPALGQAARFLAEEARQNGFVLEDDAARELAEACARDLARAGMELEKLMLYAAGRGRVTSADVEALVPAESTFTLWEISDAIGDRDVPRALRLLQEMLRQDTPPLLVASLIAGQVRKLLKCKEGAKEWVHPKVRDQARKFSAAELARALERLFEADVALRSSPPEERVVLECLVMDLARNSPGSTR